MRCGQHHRLDALVAQHAIEVRVEPEAFPVRRVACRLRVPAHALTEAQFLALPVNGIDEIAAPAAQSYDCSVNHALKSFCSSLRNSSFVRCILSGDASPCR